MQTFLPRFIEYRTRSRSWLFQRIEARLFLALTLSLAIQTILVIEARYRWSYDAYTHMFFADHYRQSWWSLWETRWYAGFDVASYPPLVHQVIALISWITGVETAFALVLLIVLSAIPAGVYSFARVFVGRAAAGYAALAAAVLPSIYLAAHTFGQLPTLAGLLAALFGFRAMADYLRSGRWLDGALVVALLAVVAALHHGTLLFLPFGCAAVALHLAVTCQTRWPRLLLRLSLVSLLSAAAILIVIWPFWVWGLGQNMQTPIDHLSRHNFIQDQAARQMFFWPVYGPLLLLIPWAANRAVLFRAVKSGHAHFNPRPKGLALGGLFFSLFLLGLGGTTPLPRLLFGRGWAWLTYDRFALWASVALLPFVGQAALWSRRFLPRYAAIGIRMVGLATLGATALYAALLPTILPTQPAPINLQPVVNFLAQGNHQEWRYLTFGFGDQFARLSLLTSATTLDGSYHTARQLPILHSSGVGQIDTAYWLPGGMQALSPIVAAAPGYGVRWAFVKLPAYNHLLIDQGWVWKTSLTDGVQVWEQSKAVNPTGIAASAPHDPLAGSSAAALSWGIFPLVALALTGSLTLARFRYRLVTSREAAQRLLNAIHRMAVGLLPVALVFWYYTPLLLEKRPGVYFTYDSALFYLSDGLLLIAVGAWLIGWLIAPHPFIDRSPRVVTWSLIGLALLGSASVLWSQNPVVSGYTALHLWLLLGLYLSLCENRQAWLNVALGCAAALFLQSGMAIWEFLAQSTAVLNPLHLKWPGVLVPNLLGASVVELLDGSRFLRAYGSLPHPNILGGFLIVLLAGPAAGFLRGGRWRWAAGGLVAFGFAAVVFTFSRAAWIGAACGAVVLALHTRQISRLRLSALAAVAALGLIAAAVPLHGLIITRLSGLVEPARSLPSTEIRSTRERLALVADGLNLIRAYPSGVGLGAYVVAQSARLPVGSLLEPVHNVPLLITGELGIAGGVLWLVLAGAYLWSLFARLSAPPTPEAIVFSAAIAAILAMSLFDHYFWSHPAGRTLVWLILGVWAGQSSPGPAAGQRRAADRQGERI